MRLARVDLREEVERVSDSIQVARVLFESIDDVVQGLRFPPAPPLGAFPCACVVDQDPPHDGRGRAEEFVAMACAETILISEPKPGLVDERGGLKRGVRALGSDEPVRDASQLCVHDREELIEGSPIPIGDGLQEPRDVVGIQRGHAGSRAVLRAHAPGGVPPVWANTLFTIVQLPSMRAREK